MRRSSRRRQAPAGLLTLYSTTLAGGEEAPATTTPTDGLQEVKEEQVEEVVGEGRKKDDPVPSSVPFSAPSKPKGGTKKAKTSTAEKESPHAQPPKTESGEKEDPLSAMVSSPFVVGTLGTTTSLPSSSSSPSIMTSRKVVKQPRKVDFYYYSPQGEKFRTENSGGMTSSATPTTPIPIFTTNAPPLQPNPFLPPTFPSALASANSNGVNNTQEGKIHKPKKKTKKTSSNKQAQDDGAPRASQRKKKQSDDSSSSSPTNTHSKRKRGNEEDEYTEKKHDTRKKTKKHKDGDSNSKKRKKSTSKGKHEPSGGMTVLGAGEYYATDPQKETTLKIVIRKQKQSSSPPSARMDEETRQKRTPHPYLPFPSAADVIIDSKKERGQQSRNRREEDEDEDALVVDEDDEDEGIQRTGGTQQNGKPGGQEAASSHGSWFEVVLGGSSDRGAKGFMDIVMGQEGNGQTNTTPSQPRQRVRIHRIETEEEQWNRRFLEVREFKRSYGHCNVPVGWRAPGDPNIEYVPDEEPLGEWVNLQRVLEEKNLLNKERKKRLDMIGFTWNAQGWDWFQQLAEIQRALSPASPISPYLSLHAAGGGIFPSFASLLSTPTQDETGVAVGAACMQNHLEWLLKERLRA